MSAAMFQVTEQTRTYPCTQCGDQLVFAIETQKLACPSCGFEADIDTSRLAAPTERDLRGTMVELRAAMATAEGPQLSGEKEIVCQNCGGRTTFSGTLTAQRCPYCATPIQRDDVHDAPARLPVDGVLPFKVPKKQATDAIEKWINSRWFAPSEFKKYNEKGSFTSIYAAYFTYDADTTTQYTGQRGDHYTVTVGSGDDQHTETRTAWSHASGTVTDLFDDLAVLANTGFDVDKIRKLEPWPTAEASPFSPEYVAGHLCRTYDNDAEQCFPEAKLGDGRRDRVHHPARHRWRRAAHLLEVHHLPLPALQAPAVAHLAAHGGLRGQAVPGVHQRRHRRGAGPAAVEQGEDRPGGPGRRHRPHRDPGAVERVQVG
jgi:DNA-directed RNA polymerase subunit RPC12/RpoP